MGRTIFRNARLLDANHRIERGTLIVEGARIAQVQDHTQHIEANAHDRVYDCAGKTIVPGLVAGHTHFTYNNLNIFDLREIDLKHPPTYMAVAAARNAEATLRAGYTSAVGAGCLYNMDVVLNQLIADGLAIGPRLIPCGKDFCVTGFPIDYKPEWWGITDTPLGAMCDGPDEFRKAVRMEAKRGVKIIKLYPEGGHGVPDRVSLMSNAELEMAVATAHDCGMRARAHVYSRDGIRRCLAAGVDVIDHADHMDEALIDEFVKRGTFVLPSLYFTKVMCGTMGTQDDCERWFDHARQSLALAVAAGVQLVTGDDFGIAQAPHGSNARELSLYVDELGIAPLEVLRWATVNGARLMQQENAGTLEADNIADLLVVEGDPLADIALISRPDSLEMVMQDGVIIESKLPQTTAAERRYA